MDGQVPPQWAADPYGRHELRYWDGQEWSEHVRDGALPSRDPVRGPERQADRPDTAEQPQVVPETPPLMSGKAHALLALLTCGLWLIIAPAIYWARRRAFKPLVAWSGAWLLIFAVGLITDGTSPSAVSTNVPTTAQSATASPSTLQPLIGATNSSEPSTPTTTSPPPAPKASTTVPKPSRTSAKPKPKPKPPATTAPPALDPQFGTCKEAKAHGYGPYYEGEDPEYDWYRDADGDGVVCE